MSQYPQNNPKVIFVDSRKRNKHNQENVNYFSSCMDFSDLSDYEYEVFEDEYNSYSYSLYDNLRDNESEVEYESEIEYDNVEI